MCVKRINSALGIFFERVMGRVEIDSVRMVISDSNECRMKERNERRTNNYLEIIGTDMKTVNVSMCV